MSARLCSFFHAHVSAHGEVRAETPAPWDLSPKTLSYETKLADACLPQERKPSSFSTCMSPETRCMTSEASGTPGKSGNKEVRPAPSLPCALGTASPHSKATLDSESEPPSACKGSTAVSPVCWSECHFQASSGPSQNCRLTAVRAKSESHTGFNGTFQEFPQLERRF